MGESPDSRKKEEETQCSEQEEKPNMHSISVVFGNAVKTPFLKYSKVFFLVRI